MNVLFVCTGNTCRSPMAEGYANAKIEGVTAKSCGICADGSPVSEKSEKAMAEIGIDISSHLSSPITTELVEWADLIICMSPSHKAALESVGIEAEVLGNGIPDPYGGDIEDYRACRDRIISDIDSLFSPFKVVPIKYDHLKEIAKLEKVCFSTPWSEESLKSAFETGTRFFVCEKSGHVFGYVGLSAILDEGYITNIAVFPEYRNMGVGSALLEYLFSFAKENGLSFISLEVRVSNEKAISLYEKFGFKVEGRRKNFYTAPQEDASIMTKRFD